MSAPLRDLATAESAESGISRVALTQKNGRMYCSSCGLIGLFCRVGAATYKDVLLLMCLLLLIGGAPPQEN